MPSPSRSSGTLTAAVSDWTSFRVSALRERPGPIHHHIDRAGERHERRFVFQGDAAARGLCLGMKDDLAAHLGDHRDDRPGCRQPDIPAARLQKRECGKIGGAEIGGRHRR